MSDNSRPVYLVINPAEAIYSDEPPWGFLLNVIDMIDCAKYHPELTQNDTGDWRVDVYVDPLPRS